MQTPLSPTSSEAQRHHSQLYGCISCFWTYAHTKVYFNSGMFQPVLSQTNQSDRDARSVIYRLFEHAET